MKNFKRNKNKLIVYFFSIIVFFLSCSFNTSAYISDEQINTAIHDNYKYMTMYEPKFGSLGGEWTVFSLARSNMTLPKNYISKYTNNIENLLIEKNGNLTKNKFTEYSRLIIALGSINQDVANFRGYNLLKPLSNFNDVKKQGINGPIWALISLDSKNYKIPNINNENMQNSREKMINYILQRQNKSGGWALIGENLEPDITAMALCALRPYYEKNNDVKIAVDKAILSLSKAQLSNGGYEYMGTENSEASSQVIIALTTYNIDPRKDKRFEKIGTNNVKNTVVDALMKYKIKNFGFAHINNEKNTNLMATEQAMQALVSIKRLKENKTNIFDFKDTIKTVKNN